MDEDECDLTSPIGQIIKHINVICKKPQIDNQLGEALDLFSERINEQQKYLSNGIFNTNFAEAALFLQSCAELYGKKVDLLWDELISCLTRLVQYDCEHEKEQGKEINQDVITKLEERREKFKRKRKSKKAEEEAKKLAEKQSNQNSETLPNQTVEQSLNNNTLDGIVDNQTLENEQHENLEFSQIPGWNDIQCLFEQIDEKQLPDKNNLLSILKVCAYGRMQFLQQKKLPLNEPFSTHKEEYLKFRNNFFENAVKKWENVTLETFEDLHKVLIYLSQKEKKKTAQTKRLLEIPQLEKPSMQDINQKVNEFLQHSQEVVSEKETVQFLEHSDDDSLFELSFICDENNTTDKNNLFVHLEQLSCDIINNKLRQDSGFYDFNSDESCHSNDTQNYNDITLQENSIPPSSTTNEVSEFPEISTSILEHTIPEQTIHQNLIMNFEEDKENQHPSVEETLNDTNCDTSSVLSDHDYCSTVTNVRTHGVRLGKRKNSRQEELLQNIINHKYCIACQTPKNHKEKCSKEKDNTALKDKQLMPPPAKKRKLTHKQIIKLLESVVPTVQENHFEKFFSENYQPGEGEGEILKASLNEGNDENVEGMSENDDQDDDNVNDDEDEEEEEDDEENEEDDAEESNENTPDATTEEAPSHNTDDPGSKVSDHIESLQPNDKSPLENEETPAPPAEDLTTSQILENLQQSDECLQRQSDMDDTLSVFSEHSYCQPRENLRNDSGFVDMIEEEEEPEPEANIETLFTRIDDIVADKDEPFSIEEEYQRLLHLLEESQKDMIDEQAGRPTEKQRREQEALELQRRVQEWENMIVPKLNELNGQDFDIHEYGTKIMDGIDVNESKPFSQIVQGLTSAEVTRYFISSLQLANTNNIELCGVKSGDISNDTFEIKLLNRDRYHERLNDYQAPSKETLRERLDRLRNERTSGKEYSKQGEDVVEKYPKKRRKHETPVNNNYSLQNSSTNINITEPSTSQERSNDAVENYLQRDSNNNGNKNKVHMDRNSSSKSTNDNPQKGKSIKRKFFSTNNHVSFEGCQAPQALSVQITSPRQLHTTSLSHWNQPSTSHRNSDSSERFLNEASFDESALERDFQRLAEVQKFYPRNQMQSTPRNDLSMTFSQSTVYSSTVGPKILFN